MLEPTMKTDYPEAVETFVRLGLTINQAKVYVSLVQSGPSTAKEVSKTAKITRQDIYRIMPSLLEESLVEKIISVPVRYKAVPTKQAISTLLQRKKAELDTLRERAEKLAINADVYQLGANFEKEFEFMFVPEKEAIIKRIRNAFQYSQISVDIVTLPRRLSQAMLEFADVRSNALKRGVRVRSISEKISAKAPAVERQMAIEKNFGMEARLLSNPPPAGVLIFDQKEVIIITSTTSSLYEAPALWSSNPCLVGLAQNYFDGLWRTSNPE